MDFLKDLKMVITKEIHSDSLTEILMHLDLMKETHLEILMETRTVIMMD